MQSYQIYKNLGDLNELPVEKAEAAFLDCCGSMEWTRLMAASRPFHLVEDMFNRASAIWRDLPTSDWLEAFAAHPEIGSRTPAAVQKQAAADWSKNEQSGADAATTSEISELERLNGLYRKRFGFIFIVCATGKTAGEMLAIFKARMGNSVKTEIQIAAEEQRKITEIRLAKLLEK